jgi:hypothetical protein
MNKIYESGHCAGRQWPEILYKTEKTGAKPRKNTKKIIDNEKIV